MSGAYGNENLGYIFGCQYVTFDGTSDQSDVLRPGTKAVTLFATAACWVKIGVDPTAAAPGAENTRVESFFVPATQFLDVAVNIGDAANPIKVAAIQDSTGGNLYVYERFV